eukprot:CAMPEP_0197832680 /NCGR_PEP_ID=MMETSP1437-20131217/15570_1 /TAXON_ID=49252 ORGANISM="Eucampia antarctica, Strain CCMP1452" /NCGR_SAMPLE_ID=MMETSP1437 /ASSEMBLY_ACC=CAM_ASM_001096 /LENGTH=297 /DNA_ID=CAMNT_0043436169 /DNA_START=32 /DNA_END=925 /DNA_ORIENTATION=+
MTPKASMIVRQIVRNTSRITGVSTRAAVASHNGSSILGSSSSQRRMASSMSAGDALKKLAAETPHKDVLHYDHKNVKWSLKQVNYFAEALAAGLVDAGLQPGDKVLSWLPLHFSEQHVLQFACSKAGFILYTLDPSQAKTDPEGAKEALKKAMEVTEANVLVTQEAGNDVNYIKLVEGVIPETRIFDFGDGMPFFSPRFPHLRFPIHTGFDITDKYGFMPLKHMLVPTGDLSNALSEFQIDGSTPLAGDLVIGSDGIPTKTGKVLSNEEVVKGNVWPELTSVLQKQYNKIGGVGVTF